MPINVEVVKPPLYGKVTWDGNQFHYVPDVTFVGRDYYIYTATDGVSSQTHINYVDTTNISPSAGSIELTIPADQVATIDVTNYMYDPDTLVRPVKVTQVTPAKHGYTSFRNNIITYQSYGYNADEFFTYIISDGQYQSIGDIKINVVGGNYPKFPDYIYDMINNIRDELMIVSLMSSRWDSTYTSVCTYSAKWNTINAARYDDTSSVVETHSAQWDAVARNITAYDLGLSLLSTNSGYWNSMAQRATALTSNSAEWNQTYALVSANSAIWLSAGIYKSTYNTVCSHSAEWDSMYNILCANSAAIGTDRVFRNRLSAYEDAYSYIYSLSSERYRVNHIFETGGTTLSAMSGTFIIPSKIFIMGWTMLADANTTTTARVLCSDFASYPNSIVISGSSRDDSDYLKLTNTIKNNTHTLTNWMTAINGNSILTFQLSTNSIANSVTVSLDCYKINDAAFEDLANIIRDGTGAYFYSRRDNSWGNLNNWFTDIDHTMYAATFPNASSNVVILGSIAAKADLDADYWAEPASIDTGSAGAVFTSSMFATVACPLTGYARFENTARRA